MAYEYPRPLKCSTFGPHVPHQDFPKDIENGTYCPGVLRRPKINYTDDMGNLLFVKNCSLEHYHKQHRLEKASGETIFCPGVYPASEEHPDKAIGKITIRQQPDDDKIVSIESVKFPDTLMHANIPNGQIGQFDGVNITTSSGEATSAGGGTVFPKVSASAISVSFGGGAGANGVSMGGGGGGGSAGITAAGMIGANPITQASFDKQLADAMAQKIDHEILNGLGVTGKPVKHCAMSKEHGPHRWSDGSEYFDCTGKEEEPEPRMSTVQILQLQEDDMIIVTVPREWDYEDNELVMGNLRATIPDSLRDKVKIMVMTDEIKIDIVRAPPKVVRKVVKKPVPPKTPMQIKNDEEFQQIEKLVAWAEKDNLVQVQNDVFRIVKVALHAGGYRWQIETWQKETEDEIAHWQRTSKSYQDGKIQVW